MLCLPGTATRRQLTQKHIYANWSDALLFDSKSHDGKFKQYYKAASDPSQAWLY